VTDDWAPITETEFLVRLEEEKRQLSPVECQRFAEWKVPVGTRGRVAQFSSDGVESVFIVARHAQKVAFFDDIEDEFAIGTIGEEGIISNPGLCGELSTALRLLASG